MVTMAVFLVFLLIVDFILAGLTVLVLVVVGGGSGGGSLIFIIRVRHIHPFVLNIYP